jgi:hypothetical protein
MGLNLPANLRTRARSAMRPGDVTKPIPTKPPRRKRGTGDHAQRKAWELEQMRQPGLFLPMRTVSEANNRDNRWTKAKRTKEQRAVTAAMVLRWLTRLTANAVYGGIGFPVIVTLTRYGPKRLDDDNLARAMKPVRDGVADAFCVDDGDERYEWRYRQERAKWYGVRIEIETRKDQSC